MSSPVGHTLAALSIYYTTEKPGQKFSWKKLVWPGWMIVAASIPDVDYLIHAINCPTFRITHSIAAALILPLGTIAILILCRYDSQLLRKRTVQILSAGLSHIFLDVLVGVTPLPLLWPSAHQTFKLPFGVLPSAGWLSLKNYYLYRNLVIEIGVLMPVTYICYRRYTNKRFVVLPCLISLFFMYQAFILSR